MLTFFSGFGLGTILLPVFALFFPIEIAIMLTAIVHFLNNIFKTGLMWKHIDVPVILKFGIPAMLGAYFGASLLSKLTTFNKVLFKWGNDFEVSYLSLIVGGIILIFALTEITYSIKKLKGNRKFLSIGGLISGFFGGLSGHQGALRSVFLLQLGLKKESFIASGIAIALFIDAIRISIYTYNFGFSQITTHPIHLLVAVTAAFSGALLGRKLLKKITVQSIQNIVGITMSILALGILTGVLTK